MINDETNLKKFRKLISDNFGHIELSIITRDKQNTIIKNYNYMKLIYDL